MATTKVTVRLRGEATRDGTIALARFAKFGSDFQTVVNRIEYVLRKDENRKPGFNPKIQKASLRLLSTGKGSFITDLEVIEPEQQTYEVNMSAKALEYFVVGMTQLQPSAARLPVGYDQGVLVYIQEMGSILKHEVEEIIMDLDAPDVHQTVVYDYPLLTTVNSLITDPEERIEAVRGHLLAVNFKGNRAERYQCRLYEEDGSYVSCTFDDDVSDEIQELLRREVSAIGIATVDSLTDTVSKLHIKKLIPLEGDDKGPEREAEQALERYRAENDTLAQFSQGLQEAFKGESRPISTLWDAFNDE